MRTTVSPEFSPPPPHFLIPDSWDRNKRGFEPEPLFLPHLRERERENHLVLHGSVFPLFHLLMMFNDFPFFSVSCEFFFRHDTSEPPPRSHVPLMISRHEHRELIYVFPLDCLGVNLGNDGM